jgi:predicted small integral membrane protein
MIGSAFIFIFWMRLGGGALWYPLGISVLYGIAMFKFA